MPRRSAELARVALRCVPWLVLAGFALIAANVAFAQKTGGSFGGGAFSSGGSSSGGSSSGYSGDQDDPTDFLILAVYVIASDLPWPLKIALLGVIAGAYLVYRGRKKRRRRQLAGSAEMESEVAPPD